METARRIIQGEGQCKGEDLEMADRQGNGFVELSGVLLNEDSLIYKGLEVEVFSKKKDGLASLTKQSLSGVVKPPHRHEFREFFKGKYIKVDDALSLKFRQLFRTLDLSGQDLKGRQFSRLDLTACNFNNADLERACFHRANLRCASFKGANLRKVNFSSTDLQGADLTYSDLKHAQFNCTNICHTNFSHSTGLIDPLEWVKENFKTDKRGLGFIVYKAFGEDTPIDTPKDWVIEPFAWIQAVPNPDRATPSGSGLAFHVLPALRNKYKNKSADIWECLLTWADLASLIVPYSPRNGARCGRLQLLRKIS